MGDNKKIKIKPKSECMWDAAALGEIMIRFDPGDMRIRTARSFKVSEGCGSQQGDSKVC